MNVRVLKILLSLLVIYLWVKDYVSAISSTFCDCSKKKVKPMKVALRVVGGKIMDEVEHPFLALIHYMDYFTCGGTVVSHKHVLTAAHCVTSRHIKEHFSVLLGVHDRVKAFNNNVKSYSVEEIIIHEDFKVLEHHILINDIALLQVNEISFNNYVQPVCLPFSFDWNGYKSGVVEGWGNTKEDGYPSRFPRKVTLSLMTIQQCHNTKVYNALKYVEHIDDMVLCAYKAFVDSCQGDSGGPLVVKTANGIKVQIGIVSFGLGCGNNKQYPGLYTKVSNYIGWLERHLHLDCSK